MVYEEKDYGKVIERIKKKIAEKGVKMGECCSGEEIARFERDCNITLPSAYKAFLQSVGDGCEMICGCALKSLAEIERRDYSVPFAVDGVWVWEDDPRPDDEVWREINEKVYNGEMEILDFGDGMTFNLIVSGKHAGEVWNFADVGVQPCDEKQDFLGWFELWLDEGDDVDYFKDYVPE